MTLKEIEFVFSVLDELSAPVFDQATKNSRKGDEAFALLSRIMHVKMFLSSVVPTEGQA